MLPVELKDSVAFVATYPPCQCGIATFTADLVAACRPQMEERLRPVVIAINDRKEGYFYPQVVRFQVDKHTRLDYVRAAEFINYNKVRVVSVQHEFGIFGGPDGSYLLDMLRELRCPIVTTLHTVLDRPTEGQRTVMKEIIVLSNQLVVMSRRAVALLREVYDAPEEKIRFIHHGVPMIPFVEPDSYKAQFDMKGRRVILTFGLLGPGKGIEYMLEALPPVVERFPDVCYVVLGATHPQLVREYGESYRLSLQRKASELGLQRNVLFRNRFVEKEELCEFLKACDIYVTPYVHSEQITSGTLAYALAAGKPVISTRYWYAQELLADGRGELVGLRNAKELSEALLGLLGAPDKVREIRANAYEFSRQMVWPEVAKNYLNAFRRALRGARVRAAMPDESMRHILPITGLPRVRLDHLARLTDDTGLLQHATYSVPNRAHGYCTDDNARGLLVATKHYRLFKDDEAERLLNIYLSFLQYSQRPDGLFHNLMSYSRQFLDEVGSDDCFGRAMWGLGYVVRYGPELYGQLAKELFERALKNLNALNLRGRAYSILGLAYYLQRYPEATDVAEKIDALARKQVIRFEAEIDAHPEWLWFEPVITYDSAVVPQSLFVAYQVTGEERYRETAGASLDFIIEKCDRGSRFSFVGNNGWHRRGGGRAQYDQQPVDACGYVEACKVAFHVSGRRDYLRYMRMAFDWFLGVNDQSALLYDFKTGACADGLMAHGVNQNRGAESTLCCLLALLTLTEIFSEQDRIVTSRGARKK